MTLKHRIVFSLSALAIAVAAPCLAGQPAPGRWDLSAIFGSEASWDAERHELLVQLDELERLAPTWSTSAAQMLAYFELDCAIARRFFRLIGYADLNTGVNQAEPRFRRMTGQMLQHFARWQEIVSSDTQRLEELGLVGYQQYLRLEPGLARFRYQVERRLSDSDSSLSEQQQRLLAGVEGFSNSFLLAYRALSSQEMPRRSVVLSDSTEQEIDYPTYLTLLQTCDAADRNMVITAYYEPFARFQNTFAALLDGEVKRRHFTATQRGYDSSLAMAMASNQLGLPLFDAAVAAVKAHLPLLDRYLSLKARMSSLPRPESTTTFDPERTEALIVQSLEPLGPEYLDVVHRSFRDGWIDWSPRDGKRGHGGATLVPCAHPYVLLNHTGTLSDVYVATHELGHAYHFWFMEQSAPCTSFSSSGVTNEIAALVNEYIFTESLLTATSDPAVRVEILEGGLDRLTAALFDQVRLAELERAMHRRVAGGNSLDATWLNATCLELLRQYRKVETDGSELNEARQYSWMSVDAFYMNHYVINYTIGAAAALALVDMVSADGQEGADRYLRFLRRGSSDAPLELLAEAGLDMTGAEPYDAALTRYEHLLDLLEADIGARSAVP